MDHYSKLLADIDSEAFKKGEKNHFWELDEIIGKKVYVWLYAPDDQAFLLEAECSNYGDEPILGSFVDSVSRRRVLSAYPKGDPVFEQWVKFQSEPPFICWDQDRGGIEHHPEWKARQAWKKDDDDNMNQLVSYLDFMRRLLHMVANGYRRKYNRLLIPRDIFNQTMSGLRERSDNWRESAGIWIGKIQNETDWTVEQVKFHHELCDDKSNALYLELAEEAKFQLYRELAQTEQEIIALIHTHPMSWVGLSHTDANNQISSQIGFWSLVVPWYGREPWNLDQIGIHVRGRAGWNHLSNEEATQRILIT